MRIFTSETGNALFLILIAVALFGALSYAITQSSRGAGNIEREKQMIAEALSEQCMASVEYGVQKLKLIGGCTGGEIDYTVNDTESSDLSCHIFAPEGAGITPCGIYLATEEDEEGCDLEALALGEKCEDVDIIYAGTSGGTRIYTTPSNQGSFDWANTGGHTSGATSPSDGFSNTNILVNFVPGAPYAAALACRGIGDDWYLPSINELNTLWNNRDTIGGFPTGSYFSSTEITGSSVRACYMPHGPCSATVSKTAARLVRCIRR